MGLDASVMCNCWKEGKCKPPPVPVQINEDGYLHPLVEGSITHRDFGIWEQSACIHEYMHYTHERISNWGGYGRFIVALEKLGWVYFPTLRAELPSANYGLTHSTAASKCLDELEFFKKMNLGATIFLVDTETGQEIRSYDPTTQGVYIFNGKAKLDIGFDSRGFFIRDSVEKREMFRSMRFEQRFLLKGEKRQVEYIALDNQAHFICSNDVQSFIQFAREWKRAYETPRYVHVAERRVDARDFAYILEPLTRIFQASVETGNPVRWC